MSPWAIPLSSFPPCTASPESHQEPRLSSGRALIIRHPEHHLKTLFLSDLCVCVRALSVGVFSPWVRPPAINRYSSLPTTEPGGPSARTKHAFFFTGLMRNRRKRGRKNVWQKKNVEGFFKTATEDLFDRGRKEREGESRDILDVETNMCAWNRITPMLPLITSR